jgi:hypothetical protein
MNPGIVTPQVQAIKDGLKSLPTMSLVMTPDDLFGTAQGIYANPNGTSASWERPASIEMIWPDGQAGFQANCGARIYGDVGRREKKKSIRLLFKGMYGQTKLEYPLFGEDAAQEFDTFILRANFKTATLSANPSRSISAMSTAAGCNWPWASPPPTAGTFIST